MVLGAAWEDRADALPLFVQRARPSYPIGLIAQKNAAAFLSLPPDELLLPHLVVVDPRGRIVAQYEATDAFFANPAKEEENIRSLLRAWVK